jgi:hypothetical protein
MEFLKYIHHLGLQARSICYCSTVCVWPLLVRFSDLLQLTGHFFNFFNFPLLSLQSFNVTPRKQGEQRFCGRAEYAAVGGVPPPESHKVGSLVLKADRKLESEVKKNNYCWSEGGSGGRGLNHRSPPEHSISQRVNREHDRFILPKSPVFVSPRLRRKFTRSPAAHAVSIFIFTGAATGGMPTAALHARPADIKKQEGRRE